MFATHQNHDALVHATTTRCLRSSQKASSRRKALVPTRRPTHTPKKSRVDAVAATGASKSFCSSAFLCPFYWGNFGSIRDDVVGVQEESSLSLSLSVLQSVRARPLCVFSETYKTKTHMTQSR